MGINLLPWNWLTHTNILFHRSSLNKTCKSTSLFHKFEGFFALYGPYFPLHFIKIQMVCVFWGFYWRFYFWKALFLPILECSEPNTGFTWLCQFRREKFMRRKTCYVYTQPVKAFVRSQFDEPRGGKTGDEVIAKCHVLPLPKICYQPRFSLCLWNVSMI